MTERAVKDWVAFFEPLVMVATPEEMGPKGTGMLIPAFEHEGFVGEEHLVTGIPVGHHIITVEPGRTPGIFATREEAEAFVASQTVRRSGWHIIPRT